MYVLPFFHIYMRERGGSHVYGTGRKRSCRRAPTVRRQHIDPSRAAKPLAAVSCGLRRPDHQNSAGCPRHQCGVFVSHRRLVRDGGHCGGGVHCDRRFHPVGIRQRDGVSQAAGRSGGHFLPHQAKRRRASAPHRRGGGRGHYFAAGRGAHPRRRHFGVRQTHGESGGAHRRGGGGGKAPCRS